MRILIADNDQPFLMLLQSYLQDQGYEVVVAEDAVACMEQLRTFMPDVLVLGRLFWGGAEGVIEAFDEESPLHRIPIILLQDSSTPPNTYHSKHSITLLQRPIRLGSLAKEIARLQLAQITNKTLAKDSFITFCEAIKNFLTGWQSLKTRKTLSHSAG